MLENQSQHHHALNEMLVSIAAHHGAYPDHGLDCACMDKFIQQFRIMTTVGDKRLQQRIDYVLRKVINSR